MSFDPLGLIISVSTIIAFFVLVVAIVAYAITNYNVVPEAR